MGATSDVEVGVHVEARMVLDAPSTLGCLAHVGGLLRAIGLLREGQLSPDIAHHGGAAVLCSGVSYSSVFWCTAFCHLSLFLFFCVDEQSDFQW